VCLLRAAVTEQAQRIGGHKNSCTRVRENRHPQSGQTKYRCGKKDRFGPQRQPKVLPDVSEGGFGQFNKVGHPHDAIAEQGDFGRLERHLGSSDHCDTDRCGRKRGRVVDAVADHGDRLCPPSTKRFLRVSHRVTAPLSL